MIDFDDKIQPSEWVSMNYVIFSHNLTSCAKLRAYELHDFSPTFVCQHIFTQTRNFFVYPYLLLIFSLMVFLALKIGPTPCLMAGSIFSPAF